MNDVFIVETTTRTVGIAIREPDGFRFHAAAHDLFHLDNRVYPSFAALRSAVASNDNAQRELRGSPRRRTRRR